MYLILAYIFPFWNGIVSVYSDFCTPTSSPTCKSQNDHFQLIGFGGGKNFCVWL